MDNNGRVDGQRYYFRARGMGKFVLFGQVVEDCRKFTCLSAYFDLNRVLIRDDDVGQL